MVYDVVIIGSGGAGMSAALSAKEKGASVLVVSEGFPTRSQTCMAQGGINAALGNTDEDSVASHIQDTQKSAKGLASSIMIEKMCGSAIETLAWLNSIGVPFSRTKEGKIAQRRLGGASAMRACYAQDYTGLKILHTLYDQCLKEEIPFLNEHHMLNLSQEGSVIDGVTVLDIASTEVKFIGAKSVILATGGYSGIYYGYTTNTNQSTGDGIAAAHRAGAQIANMEFVQFHPTGLNKSGVLVSESARGAGGYLLNEKGERFVDELKPRDEVSRAIWEENEKGHQVFLDIRHLGEAYIDENIPQERKLSIMYEGVDPVHDIMPIKSVAHYSMGGIQVDDNLMSSIEGLFAVGECSHARVHGANRLGGNSLLEIVAFGKLSGENAAKLAQSRTIMIETPRQLEEDKVAIEALYEKESEVNFYEARETLGKAFYDYVGIVRSESVLKKAQSTLESMKGAFSKMSIVDKSHAYNTNLMEFIKFQNTLELSQLILDGAMQRKESRGAHYRDDFPQMKEVFAIDTIAVKGSES